jgi:hypothetical protein
MHRRSRMCSEKLLTPSLRMRAVTWAIREKGYSQRRACGLVGLRPKAYRYASKRTWRWRTEGQAARTCFPAPAVRLSSSLACAEAAGVPHDCQRQRHRVHLECHPGLAAGERHRIALHRTGKTDAERLRREFQKAGCATSASTSTCSATSTRRVRSSKHGGDDYNTIDTTRACSGLTSTEFAARPKWGKTGTDSPYERGQIGGSRSRRLFELRPYWQSRYVRKSELSDRSLHSDDLPKSSGIQVRDIMDERSELRK